MKKRRLVAAVFATALTSLALAAGPAFGAAGGLGRLRPTVGTAAAFDVSPALRDMPMLAPGSSQHTWWSSVPRDRRLVGRATRAAHDTNAALPSQVAHPHSM